MPRAFTETEKQHLQAKLKNEGYALFSRYGLKKTTVEEIARAAGIAKGSFYIFFSNKEELFIEIMEDLEQELRSSLLREIKTEHLEPKEQFKLFFSHLLHFFDNHEIAKAFIDRETIDHLLRTVPEHRIKQHIDGDEEFYRGMIEEWQQAGGFIQEDPAVLAGLFRSLFFIAIHKQEIGEELYPHIAAVLVDIMAKGCFE